MSIWKILTGIGLILPAVGYAVDASTEIVSNGVEKEWGGDLFLGDECLL